jgi:hypothetical protein
MSNNLFSSLCIDSDSDNEENITHSNNDNNNNNKNDNFKKGTIEVKGKEIETSKDDFEWEQIPKFKPSKKKTFTKNVNTVAECEIYNPDNFNSEDIGNNIKLNTVWTIWKHSNRVDRWDVDSYEVLYKIETVGDFWRFFNNFHLINKFNDQFFLFRKKIAPVWEDDHNKQGCTFSMMFDINNNKMNDIVSQIFTVFSLLTVNECIIVNNPLLVNGISFAAKKKGNMIVKIWFSKDMEQRDAEKFINQNLINNIENEIKVLNNFVPPRKTSLKCKSIKPEF